MTVRTYINPRILYLSPSYPFGEMPSESTFYHRRAKQMQSISDLTVFTIRAITPASYFKYFYKVRNYFFRRYDLIRTGLPKTQWCDKDYLMLHGMMGLLVDYVEKEKCFETIEWTSDKEHIKVAHEIKEILT